MQNRPKIQAWLFFMTKFRLETRTELGKCSLKTPRLITETVRFKKLMQNNIKGYEVTADK